MNLNNDFEVRTRALFGEERYSRFVSALGEEPVVSVRANNRKPFSSFDGVEVPWAAEGCYLPSRPVFTADPLFHAGCYYVQEASSMFLEQVVKQYVDGAVRALDLCAAPGGKTTHLLSLLPQGSMLVSNEPVPARAQVLAENVVKWGHPSAMVTRNEPADFSPFRNFFDLIVVDAPCSGEGMFRKDEGAVTEWSRENVEACVVRQRKILQDAWDALRPGGVLIYSTCTFNPWENEDNVSWIVETLGADVLDVVIDPSWGITVGNPGYHFYPHKTRGEGFYLCALRKHTVGFAPVRPLSQRLPKYKPSPAQPVEGRDIMRTWLQHPDQWVMRQQDRFVVAYPAKYKEFIELLNKQFICISTGFGLGEIRGKSFVPQHALAMAKELRKEAFTQVELTLEQALSYLRTEALQLTDAPVDVLLVTYQHIPLGFVKSVGNRCNNLYPKEWRIRKL